MASPLLHCDLAIRAAGVGLLAAAIGLCGALFHAPAAHDAEVCAIAAAAGFVAASLGAALLLLGRHVHDRVPVSSRWASTSRFHVVR